MAGGRPNAESNHDENRCSREARTPIFEISDRLRARRLRFQARKPRDVHDDGWGGRGRTTAVPACPEYRAGDDGAEVLHH